MVRLGFMGLLGLFAFPTLLVGQGIGTPHYPKTCNANQCVTSGSTTCSTTVASDVPCGCWSSALGSFACSCVTDSHCLNTNDRYNNPSDGNG